MPAVTGNNFYIDKHDLHFRTGTTNVATINYDTSDESISLNVAGTGAINIGDAGGDLFIGDGTSETDIVFEQNGAIRALTNKTLTLGQTDSNVTIAAQNFTISGTSVVTDMSGRLQVQTIEATDNTAAGWAGTDNQYGTIYMSDEGRGLLGNMGGGYARPLISSSSNAITIGSNGTSAIRNIKYNAGNGAGAADSEHNFYTSGSNLRMHIAKNGRIGIGINDPDATLEIKSTGTSIDTEAFRVRNANDSELLRVEDNGIVVVPNNYFYASSSAGAYVQHDLRVRGSLFNDQGTLNIGNSSGTAFDGDVNFDSNTLYVDSTNNRVGMGTNNPSSNLHVTGTVLIEGSVGDGVLNITNAAGSQNLRIDQNSLRTTTNNNLVFLTNGNSNSLVLEQANNRVGIGTNAPTEKLHVVGDILIDAGTTNTNTGELAFTTQYNTALLRSSYTDPANTTESYLAFHANTAGAANGTVAEQMRIAGQNVGIGTTDPATTLDLSKQNGLVELSIRRKGSDPSANTDLGGIQFKTDYTSNSHDVGRILVKTNSSAYRTDMKFSARSTAGTEMVGMTLHGTTDSGPYLGVGTETPSSLLHVRGSDPVLKITDSSDTTNFATLWLQESDNFGAKLKYDSNSNTFFKISIVDGGTETDRFSIKRGGEVGIGTYDPGATLDLRGDMRLDSGGSTDRSIYFRNQATVAKVRSDAALQFDVGVSSSPSVAMYIEEETRTVGIGTDAPRSGKLHIYNTNHVSDGDGSASMNPTGQDSIVLYTQGGPNKNFGSISWLDGGRRRAMIAAAAEKSDGDYQGLSFFTRGTDGPGDLYESMRINHGGTIGMGVTGAGDFNANAERLVVGDGAGNEGITIYAGTSSAGSLYFADGTAGDAAYRGYVQYSHGAEKLLLGAGGITQMTLTNSSRVGIGTDTPTKQVEIRDTEPFLRLEESDSGGNKRLDLFVSNSTGVIAANQSAQTMMFQTTNATRMTITSAGKVGINETSVDTYLHLSNSAEISQKFERPGVSAWRLGIPNSQTYFAFDDTNDDLSTPKLVITKTDGRVGIGTNNPIEKLDVVGFIRMGNATAHNTQKIARQVVRAYDTTHNDFMAFMGTANQTSNVVSYGGGSADQTCATKLAFYTHTDVSTSTAGTQRMHINSIGKVGIGAATSFSTDHAGMKLQICAEDTSPSLNTTSIDDCSLVISNEDEDYGTVFAVKSNGIGQIQQRRMSSATYYSLELQPFGGNVGIGTENPSYKLQVNGDIVGSSKSFLIDHPTQTGKKLMHACIEGPENGVYFRGKSQTSLIEAPEYWSGLVDIDTMTVDVTPIGPNQSIYVDRIEDNGDIYVGANTDQSLNYFYVVYGERKDIDKLEVVKDAPVADTAIV